MTLTAEETVLYTARLAEAELAYHELRIGNKARVFVDQNGERVEFAVASADRLRAYIMDLKARLGQPIGIVGPANIWTL